MSGNGQMRQDRALDGVTAALGPIVDPGANAAAANSARSGSDARGVGGHSVRNSDSEEEEELTPPLPPQSGDGNSLASTLLALGVFVLAPARMRATATALSGADITSEQIRDLAAFLAETEADVGKQRKYLASILVDVGRTAAALKNLSDHRAAAAKAKAGDDSPAHMVNMPIGTPSCLCHTCREHRAGLAAEPWDHDRQCRVAYCMHKGDRRTVAEIAALLGVSETTVGVMVERGKALSSSAYVEDIKVPRDWKRIERDERGGAERLREFREATRSGRLRMMQGDA